MRSTASRRRRRSGRRRSKVARVAGSKAPSPEVAERLRALPSVEELAASLGDLPHADAVRAARAVIDAERARILTPEHRGDTPPGGGPQALADAARAWLAADSRPRLRRVINASGVIVHTQLCRAPLSGAGGGGGGG